MSFCGYSNQVTHAGLFTSIVVAIYCMTLTASALASEPDTHECKGLGHNDNDFSTFAGFLFTLIVILVSIIRASMSSSAFDMGTYNVSRSNRRSRPCYGGHWGKHWW